MVEKNKSVGLIFLYAFLGWAWCGLIMGIGPLFLPMSVTLIVHALFGPAGFGILTWMYYRKNKAPKPIDLAVIFTLFVIVVDAALVAPVFVRSYAMFQSFIGTWLVFLLIFLTTLIVGQTVRK